MVVHFHIVLSEPEPLGILAVDASGNAEELRDSDVDRFAAWRADAVDFVVEPDDLKYLFNAHLSSAARRSGEAAVILDDAVFGEQAYPWRLARLHVDLFQLLQIASEKELDRVCRSLPCRGAVQNGLHICPNQGRVWAFRNRGRLRDRNGSPGFTILPAVVDELDVQDAAGEVVLVVQAVDDGVRNDVPRLGGNVVERVRQTEERAIHLLGQVRLAVALEHHLVDEAQLMV
ncbi:hypothetical protein PG985_011044 [Apiospora marii]|uniref:Uncharacterized protein n=1 Tax=Apiospora marii TaxID=335849 RepID=A0ABR1SSM0_9PEZI